MYIKQLALCGCILFIEKYHTYRYKAKGACRDKKKNQTTEEQQAINERHASRRRVMKGCTNFKKGDLFIRLSYFKGERPESIDAAHEIFCKFLKACKRKYPELKYMGCTELGSLGGLHHHLLVPADFDMNFIKKKWRGGWENKSAYSEDLSQLASYFTKGECFEMFEETRAHTEVEKKYTASRNLEKPYIRKEPVKKSDHWIDTPSSMVYEGKVYDLKKGSEWSGWTKDGFPYQHYIMIERPGQTPRRE